MKKNFSLIAALTLVVLLAAGGRAGAYTVSGDVTYSGTYSATGALWGVLSMATLNVNGTPANPNGTENWVEGDYVQVTGANGSSALYSVGELDPNYGYATVTLTSNASGGYNLSGAGRSVSNVTSIKVVHAVDPVKGGPVIYSTSFTVSADGTLLDTYSLSSTGNLADTAGKLPTSTVYWGGSAHPYNYTGFTVLGLLQSLGVNTSNLNQYIVVKATDNYATVLSMGEIVNGEAAYIGYKGDPTDLTPSVGPEVVNPVTGKITSGYDGFARIMFPNEAAGIWVSRVSSIEVESAVPVPASLLLFAPGLLGLFGLRRRFKN